MSTNHSSSDEIKKLIQSHLEQVVKVLNSGLQSCHNNMILNQEITVECDPDKIKDHDFNQKYCNGSVSIIGNTFSQYGQIDSNCVQQTINTQQNDKTINDAIEELTNNLVENIKSVTNIEDSKVKINIKKLIDTINVQIRNQFSQECFNQITESQSIVVKDREKGDITITNNDMEQTASLISTCISTNQSVLASISNLQTFISDNDANNNSANNSGDGTNNNDYYDPKIFFRTFGFPLMWAIVLIMVLVFKLFHVLKDSRYYLLWGLGASITLLINYIPGDIVPWPYTNMSAKDKKITFGVSLAATCFILLIILIVSFRK
jgi:hypothetical protein